MIYTVTFNPALDYVLRIADLQTGEINRSQYEQIYCGGKGINVSIVLKHLGVESIALGFQGGFTGQEILRQLGNMGIKTDFVQLESGISRVNIKIKGKQETDLNANGPVINKMEYNCLMDKIADLTQDDTLILSGSVPSCLRADVYEQIMELLKDKHVKVIVDAEQDLLIRTLPYRPFLIKPNHYELGAVFETICMTESEIVACIRRIQKMGARNVLVSRAGDGAVFGAEDGSIYRIGSPQGEVKNSVGAGDSMIAGFLKGSERSQRDALCYAAAAGSATAFSDSLAQKEAIAALLSQVKVEEII